MTEEPFAPLVFFPAEALEIPVDGSLVAIVRTADALTRYLQQPPLGVEWLQVEGLIGDADVWAQAAQGTVEIPLDVVLEDPVTEFSSLYRLADVRLVRPVRVTIPAKPGFLKALRLAASIQLSVRLLPGQPDETAVVELVAAMEFYLRDPAVEAPVEFFHSVLSRFRGNGAGTMWNFLEQDPAEFALPQADGTTAPVEFVQTHVERLLAEEAECATCPWLGVCAGYFKWPNPGYDCAGVKELFASLASAAEEINRDLAEGELAP